MSMWMAPKLGELSALISTNWAVIPIARARISGFLGPREVGVLYVRKERIAEIWPNTVAPGWGVDAIPDVVGARKFESPGQRDDARLAALRIAADFHEMIGPEKIEAALLELSGRLKSRIKDLGLPLVTPLDPAMSGGVVVVRAAADKGKQAYETLDQKWGISGRSDRRTQACVLTSTTQWLISIGRLREFNQFAICSLR